LFAFEQQKPRKLSRVSDEYDDVDEAEDSKSVYKGTDVLM